VLPSARGGSFAAENSRPFERLKRPGRSPQRHSFPVSFSVCTSGALRSARPECIAASWVDASKALLGHLQLVDRIDEAQFDILELIPQVRGVTPAVAAATRRMPAAIQPAQNARDREVLSDITRRNDRRFSGSVRPAARGLPVLRAVRPVPVEFVVALIDRRLLSRNTIVPPGSIVARSTSDSARTPACGPPTAVLLR
jgi:hypothetical protein